MTNSADSDQKPTDLDLRVCKGRVSPGSAGPGLRNVVKIKLLQYLGLKQMQ